MAKLGERIRAARKRKGFSQKELAEKIGVKSGSVISNWESGYAEPSANALMNLATELDIGLDQLLDYYGGHYFVFTTEDEERIRKFRDLDDDGKRIVDAVLSMEHERCTRPKPKPRRSKTTTINCYGLVAAGPGGAWFTDGEPEEITISADGAPRADYAVIVYGDSMEPEYHDGDLLLVRQTSALDPGELGVFAYDGKGYFKKLGKDGTLVSLNSKYDPIVPGEDACYVQGRVIGKAQRVNEQ